MAPSRKQSNGRSPLVKPQRQITTFFSKQSPPSTSPQTFSKTQTPKISNPNPSSPYQSPTTPSPIQSKQKKPLLVIGEASPSQSPSPQTPAAARQRAVCGKEVVGKRIRVYWPLDRRWYEGLVKLYDEGSGKHLVRYDDSEEEVLDLGEEKVEWVEESVRKFKRLRKACFSLKNTVVEDNEEVEDADADADSGGGDNDDNSSDEDWGKNVKDISEEEDGDVDLEDESVEEVDVIGKGGRKGESKKRKVSEAGWTLLSSAKKTKSSGDTSNGKPKVPVVESTTNRESE